MSKFLVVYEGSGEGCDYTIGCNTRVISALYPDRSIIDVANKIHAELASDNPPVDLDMLASVTVYEILEEKQIELTVVHADLRKRIETAEAAKNDENERREYERLRAKFETKP